MAEARPRAARATRPRGPAPRPRARGGRAAARSRRSPSCRRGGRRGGRAGSPSCAGVIAASSSPGPSCGCAGSTSTKTGRAPFSRMASPVAMKVLATVTTSSPGPDAVGPQGEVEGVGAVGHRAGVGGAAEGRELLLEQRARPRPGRSAVLARTRATASSTSGRMRASWAFRSTMGGSARVVGHGATEPSYRQRGAGPRPRRGSERGGRAARRRGPRGSGSPRECPPRRPRPLAPSPRPRGCRPT